jgi:hypothetical protein
LPTRGLAAFGKRTHLPVMVLDLTEEETDALARLLRRTISPAPWPGSFRSADAAAVQPTTASITRSIRSAPRVKPEPGPPMALGNAAAAHVRRIV